MKLTEKDTIEIAFIDGEKTATASIPLAKIKERLEDLAWEMITETECNSSSCAANNFCECDPINEDMEFAGIYVRIGENDDLHGVSKSALLDEWNAGYNRGCEDTHSAYENNK